MSMQGAPVSDRPTLIEGGHNFASLTDLISGLVERPARLWWWLAFLPSAALCALGGVMTIYVVSTGIGIWGLNNPVGWALAITNFVFWIGIGHAGTLISAILFLFRQKWRSSLNRTAEAMTLCALVCAGLYVLIHMGRVWVCWYMAPLPSATAIYPNFRSALSWDFAAVSTYMLVSLMFWYVGLIPDLATLRDRGGSRFRRQLLGLFALGWRGSARHWRHYEMAYLMLAALATPLVVSVHTIVSFDFATAVVPGWHTTIYPPYFVTGAIFSGLAMVITLMVPLRTLCGLKDVVTKAHLENVCKLILATGLLLSYGYAVELFIALYGDNPYEKFVFRYRMTGPFAWCYWTMIACNVLSPQLFWFRRFRTTPWAMFGVAILVNVGMWFERFVIIVTSLQRDYLPSSWGAYAPTWPELLQMLGSFGLFLTPLLLFVRFVPMIALCEVKACLPEADPHHAGESKDADGDEMGSVSEPEGDGPLYGVLARFGGPGELLGAAERLRAAGYQRIDGYSPFPIHGSDAALGLGRSRLPVLVFVCALLGAAGAQTLQWYESAVAYPLITGGKPYYSPEAFVPITFETTILCGALAAVGGMLLLNGLPQLYHPVFRSPTFARATRDGFFLSVEARDPTFDRSATPALLAKLGGREIELLES